jgi:hypothetical protein
LPPPIGLISDNNTLNYDKVINVFTNNGHTHSTTTLSNGDIITANTSSFRLLGKIFDDNTDSQNDGWHGGIITDYTDNQELYTILTYKFSSGAKTVTRMEIFQSPWSFHNIGAFMIKYKNSTGTYDIIHEGNFENNNVMNVTISQPITSQYFQLHIKLGPPPYTVSRDYP